MSTETAVDPRIAKSNDALRTPMGEFWRKFKKQPVAMAAAGFVFFLIIVAIVGPMITPFDPENFFDYDRLNEGPSAVHWVGVDALGRDIFSRVVYAARVSMSVGVVAVGISTTIGIILGAIAGYFGKWADTIIMRAVDVVYCFPVMFLVIIISTMLKPSIYNIMLVIGLCNWTGTARFVRGEILRVRELEYVQASVSLGAKDGRIIWSHIIPNVMAPIIVEATLQMAHAILTEASLSYLGVGVQMPMASWGNMLMDANNLSTLTLRPWQWVPPGICILLAVLSINFIGDGMRDALDARQKK